MMIPKQEKRFEYKGFPCVILFMPMGYRCGYVGLSIENKYYGKSYDDIPISCHCGLTYASRKLHAQNDTDKWWIGFDCGHCCDGYDVDKIKEFYADDENIMTQTERMADYFKICNENPVRKLEYCEEECKKIVEQIIELEKGTEVQS